MDTCLVHTDEEEQEARALYVLEGPIPLVRDSPDVLFALRVTHSPVPIPGYIGILVYAVVDEADLPFASREEMIQRRTWHYTMDPLMGDALVEAWLAGEQHGMDGALDLALWAE